MKRIDSINVAFRTEEYTEEELKARRNLNRKLCFWFGVPQELADHSLKPKDRFKPTPEERKRFEIYDACHCPIPSFRSNIEHASEDIYSTFTCPYEVM